MKINSLAWANTNASSSHKSSMLSNTASSILNADWEKTGVRKRCLSPFSCLNFPQICPVAMILGIAPPTGGNSKFLRSTNIVSGPNIVKVYHTVWFPVAHFSCHYSDPFIPGINGHKRFLIVGEKYLRSQYVGLLSSGHLYF